MYLGVGFDVHGFPRNCTEFLDERCYLRKDIWIEKANVYEISACVFETGFCNQEEIVPMKS